MRIYDNGTYREATPEEIAATATAQTAYEAAERIRPLTESEVTRLIIRQRVNSLDIDDATASRMAEYFPELTGGGSLVESGTRIHWNGVVKRAAVDLWDTKENTPDAAPALWEDIPYRNGIRIIPEAITAGTAFSLGEQGWWGNAIYESTYDGLNVWTPEGYPDGWKLIYTEG